MNEPEPAPAPGHGTDGEPRPVADIDDLFDQLAPLHRVRWIILTGFGLLMAAALIVLGVLYAQQNAAVRSSCEFWGGVLTLPAAPTPPATKPSRTLIVLIASSREAWAGERCGPLPPPSQDLRHWAAVYQVTLH